MACEASRAVRLAPGSAGRAGAKPHSEGDVPKGLFLVVPSQLMLYICIT